MTDQHKFWIAKKSLMLIFFNIILTLIFISITPVTQAACLEKINARYNLERLEVYKNGKLKFRIDGWDCSTKFTIDVSSNAPSFNGHISMNSVENVYGDGYYVFYCKFSRKDTTLCPGVELIVECENFTGYDYWKCQFSEF